MSYVYTILAEQLHMNINVYMKLKNCIKRFKNDLKCKTHNVKNTVL
jgi:hypothetical protein